MESSVPKLFILAVITGLWRVQAQIPEFPEASIPTSTNFVKIQKHPSYLQGRSKVEVEYRCEEDGVVVLDVEVIAEGLSSYTSIFSKAWKCQGQGFQGRAKTKAVKLRLPTSVKNRPDFFNRKCILVSQSKLKVALYGFSDWINRHSDTPSSKSRSFTRLPSLPPFSRPFFSPACHTWLLPLLQRSWRLSDSQTCMPELEEVTLLNYPVVFSGTTSGVLRSLPAFFHPQLEQERRQAYTRPKFSVELWLYILDYCPLSEKKLKFGCGLLSHVGHNGQSLTPSLFINHLGQIQVDAYNDKGSFGVKTFAPVPKNVWTRVIFTLEDRTWFLHVHSGKDTEQEFVATYVYGEDMHFDDTEGYFSIGGLEPVFGSFVGYVGKAVIYRRRIVIPSQLNEPHPFHPMFQLHLSKREEKCQNFLSWMDSAITIYKNYIAYSRITREDSCRSVAYKLSYHWSKLEYRESCPLKHPHRRKFYRHIGRFLRQAVRNFRLTRTFESVDFEAYSRSSEASGNREAFLNISNNLMDAAKTIVAKKGLKKARGTVPLLKQAACLGNDDAMFYLAVMLNNGVGIAADEIQSLAFYMLGALNKHSLSTMAMGHRHMMGIDGAPWDFDIAYMYYRVAADITKDDREAHRDTQVATEGIRLIDDARMKSQTSEVGDLFMWLRHQAEKGVTSARSELASMLYWGARGIQRNLQNALNVYRAGAEAGNAESMFNYGIMQYRGMGGDVNKTAGIEMMQKAAQLKDRNAISALGWLALTKQGNMTEAFRLFKMARRMGHPDSGYYLGQMHFNGLVPNSTADWDTALVEYEWSALREHVHAGIMFSHLLSRGTTSYPRNTVLAAEWARFIAEKNVDLAQPLRDAVNAYRDGNTDLAVYLYLILADTGYEVASFNLAYLCELNEEGVSSYLSKECQWRHYNLTTHRQFQFVDSYSFIKMGDFHWYGCLGNRNLTEAARFYSQAALKHDPQALFNLAYMVEEGTPIVKSIWRTVSIPEDKQTSNYTILTELYSRCRESRRSEAFIPCSLALARIQVLNFWQDYYVYMQITSYFGITIVVLTVIFATCHFLHLRRERRKQELEEEEERRVEEMSKRDSELGDGEAGPDGGEGV